MRRRPICFPLQCAALNCHQSYHAMYRASVHREEATALRRLRPHSGRNAARPARVEQGGRLDLVRPLRDLPFRAQPCLGLIARNAAPARRAVVRGAHGRSVGSRAEQAVGSFVPALIRRAFRQSQATSDPVKRPPLHRLADHTLRRKNVLSAARNPLAHRARRAEDDDPNGHPIRPARVNRRRVIPPRAIRRATNRVAARRRWPGPY